MHLTTTRWLNYEQYGSPHHSVVGTVKVRPAVRSPQLQNTRDILVYLPPSYGQTTRRYPVLYMHDGQNLFDRATSYAGEWCVDETMEALSQRGLEAIVVGIPNSGVTRCNEYSPFADARHGEGCGDQYLRFLTETIKPCIDHDFRTLPDREHTGIAGSSMGGLISLYGFLRHPNVFGFASVMSPSLWYAQRAIFPFVQRTSLAFGRLYLDMGTAEGAVMLRDVRRMQRLLRQKGYRLGHNLQYVEAQGAGHCEAAWAYRMRDALQYFLRPMQHTTAVQAALPTHASGAAI